MKEMIGWFLVVVALLGLGGIFLYIGYEAGRLKANRKWLYAVQRDTPPPVIMYDVVFYIKNEYRVHVIPVEADAMSVVDGCFVTKKPDFRSYCDFIAAYPCMSNCNQSTP